MEDGGRNDVARRRARGNSHPGPLPPAGEGAERALLASGYRTAGSYIVETGVAINLLRPYMAGTRAAEVDLPLRREW
jgi:hypothetical protein